MNKKEAVKTKRDIILSLFNERDKKGYMSFVFLVLEGLYDIAYRNGYNDRKKVEDENLKPL